MAKVFRRELSGTAVLVMAGLAVMVGSLDSALNIAFPDLTVDFELDVTAIQWMVVSYVLTYASLLLPIGRVADRWGHRRVLVVGLVVSTVAFALAGGAPSYAWLFAARVVQGVGVACIFSSTPALITLSVSSQRRGQALGVFQMSAAIGLALGPIVGGLLVRAVGWRGVFWFRVPLALLLLVIIVTRPSSKDRDAVDDRPLDALGAGLFVVGIGALLLSLSLGRSAGWGSLRVLVAVVLGSAAVAAFIAIERRAVAPLVDLKLFGYPGFGLANVLNLLANATMFGVWLLVPFYLVDILGFGTIVGGMMLTVMPAAIALLAPLAGRLADRLGTAPVSSVGLFVEALGLAIASRLGAETSVVWLLVALAVIGAGLGIFQVPNMSFVMGSIPRTSQGVAGGMTQMMRTAGVVIGVSVTALLFAARRAASGSTASISEIDPTWVAAFNDVFVASAAVCGLAAVVSLRRRRADVRRADIKDR